jgi:hypothetical protein
LPIEGSIYNGDVIDEIELDREEEPDGEKIFIIKWR